MDPWGKPQDMFSDEEIYQAHQSDKYNLIHLKISEPKDKSFIESIGCSTVSNIFCGS